VGRGLAGRRRYLATALGWLLAGRTLRPIDRITETAQRIAGADGGGRGLHERIGLDGPPDEVKRLADTFDLMLERLDRSFEGQRRFVANASHELRTPLQVNQTLIELAVSRPGAGADIRQLGEALLEVNARHERLTDGLLTLADSENEVADRRPVDLAEVTRHVLAETATPAGRDGIKIRPADLGAAPTTGDPYLLERLVQNLVENAVKHNHPGRGWLCARTWSAGRRVWLEVTNSGPVVPSYETEILFEPFHRTRTTMRRGFGLGLSIVQAVARAHGGEVRAQPRAEGGLVVTVALPASG
jgi:signal transduction histidine kinase